MKGQRKNRWDVQVVFPDISFGSRNRADVAQSPETVCEALEEFCRRVRASLDRRAGTVQPEPQQAPHE